MPLPLSNVGVVAIGRNESARLAACLRSLPRDVAAVVYSDSGSTDDSVALARSAGVEVVESDPAATAHSAAAARNAGFRRLLEIAPGVEFVQFVDGDCELDPGWLPAAQAALEAEPDLVAVWGWRREERPAASVYNRISDLEWKVPPAGETRHFGGDTFVRAAAVRDVGGYDPAVVASEDHELSLRLRSRGWRIRRLDLPMTVHDARMTRLGQWWRKNVRRGVGYGQVWERHRQRSEVVGMARSLGWGMAVPAAAVALAWPTWGLSLAAAAGLYAVRTVRVRRGYVRGGGRPADATVWAAHCVGSSAPFAWGIVGYAWTRLRRRRVGLIEYHPAPAAGRSKAGPR